MDRRPAAQRTDGSWPTIAVTGLGLITPLGASPDETFDAILAGRCGLGAAPAMEQHELARKGAGQAVDLPSSSDDGSRVDRYLRAAIEQALRSAQVPLKRARIAVVMGTTLHGMPAAGRFLRSGEQRELRDFSANAVLARAVAGLPVRSAGLSTCSACSSGLAAVSLGITLLRAAKTDVVVAGGYDVISEYAYAGFDALRLIAQGPPRPFGAQRDGMKTSEGYGAVVLERLDDAQARGAAVRACMAGVAETSDVHHLTQPHPEGLGAARAMREALAMSGLAADELSLVSAHATATVNNDASEYAAMRASLGEALARLPVVAFKSHLGHTLGAAGAVELVLSILSLERAVVPPTLNGAPIDAAFECVRCPQRAEPMARAGAAINTSLGFGGANASVVTTRHPPARRPAKAPPQRAVITGLGIVVPGAVGAERFVALLGGGVDQAKGPVPEESIHDLVQARRVRRMSEYAKLTIAAGMQAYRAAGLDREGEGESGVAAMLGTTHGSSNFCEQFYGEVVRDSITAGNPALFAEGVPNAAAAQLSMALSLHGGCQTIVGSRTAGLDALALAALRIEQGQCEQVIVSAGEEYCETVSRAHRSCAASEEAIGSGAIALVVESRDSTARRGARVLAAVGTAWWEYGRPLAALARLVRRSDGPLIATLGHSPLDRRCRQLLEAEGRQVRHLRPRLAELFSVGPLAAVAAQIVAPDAISDAGARGTVVATDYQAGATGVEIRTGTEGFASSPM